MRVYEAVFAFSLKITTRDTITTGIKFAARGPDGWSADRRCVHQSRGCKEIMAEKYGELVLRKRGRPPSWGLFEYGIMRALYEGRPWARTHLVTVSPSLCSSVALYCSVLGRQTPPVRLCSYCSWEGSSTSFITLLSLHYVIVLSVNICFTLLLVIKINCQGKCTPCLVSIETYLQTNNSLVGSLKI